jgi:hypothetical protein
MGRTEHMVAKGISYNRVERLIGFKFTIQPQNGGKGFLIMFYSLVPFTL